MNGSLRMRSKFVPEFVPDLTKETPRMISRSRFFCVLAFAVLVAAFVPTVAGAAAKELKVTDSGPDYVSVERYATDFVVVRNTSGAALNGNLIITMTLPSGIAFVEAEPAHGPGISCSTVGQETQCVIDVTGIPIDQDFTEKLFTYVESGASGVLNGQIEVSGGGTSENVTVPFSRTVGPIPSFGIQAFGANVWDQAGDPASTAASFPAEIDTRIELLAYPSPLFGLPFSPQLTLTATPESYRDVVVHTPAGLVGYPSNTAAKCTPAELSENKQGGVAHVPACPQDSQIGLAEIFNGDLMPLYNVVPPHGVPAMFGFNYNGNVITLKARLRPSDNGVDIVSENIPNSTPIPDFAVELWGVPSDASHDRLRPDCFFASQGGGGGICPSEARRAPFLRMPTSCGGQLSWGLEIDTWENPGVFHPGATTSPGMEGCGMVPFDPKVSLAPSDRGAHSPSGLDVNLDIPQENGPGGLSEADLRQVALTLPQGVAVNPASADGLAACSDSQLRLGLSGPSECPEAAKLGSVEVKTPLLEEALEGSVYLRSQASQDPASGEMYRLAIELRSDARGVDVKLPGSLKVDPATGQLTTTFSDLPQLPFETMELQLKAGPRAPLTLPQACGDYAAQATFTGWNGKTVTAEPGFSVDQGCTAPGFKPGFEAGVSNPTAGDFSPFSLRVTRDPGMPNLSRIDATLPEGALAKLAGVAVCSDAQAAAGACPDSSQVGRVVAAVGEGSSPLYLPQAGKASTAVYLAGPYKGAPYSILTKVPAQSGPFDLGNVLVRSALRVDPTTTQASVESDVLPQIFGGIPVSYRDVRVEVDRPEFTINPTDCEPTAVTGTIGSSTGQSVAVSDRFQVADCAALGFKPKLSIGLKGRTTRAGHPALTAVLQMPKKGANIARTSVALPHSEFLAQGHINTSCTRVQFNAGAGGGAGCPKGSVYGRARAFSPLLDYPLEGPVYLRSNGGERELPDLVAALGGQIHVDLVGYIDTDEKTGGIRTTFAKVPDAPVSKFVLKMPAGKKSLLENSTNICRGKHHAVVKFDGQNGRVSDFRPLVRAGCGKSSS